MLLFKLKHSLTSTASSCRCAPPLFKRCIILELCRSRAGCPRSKEVVRRLGLYPKIGNFNYCTPPIGGVTKIIAKKSFFKVKNWFRLVEIEREIFSNCVVFKIGNIISNFLITIRDNFFFFLILLSLPKYFFASISKKNN